MRTRGGQLIQTDRGQAVLRDPLLYKGSAFTTAERRLLGLSGLLPSGENTQDQQAIRFYETDLEVVGQEVAHPS